MILVIRYGAEIVMRGTTQGDFDMVLVPVSIHSFLHYPTPPFLIITNTLPRPLKLDVTTKHTVHFDKLIHTPTDLVLQDFLNAILGRPRKIMLDLGYKEDVFEMHDPLAAYYVIDNTITDHAKRWKTSKRVFLMERTGEWTKGTCVVDRRYASFILKIVFDRRS